MPSFTKKQQIAILIVGIVLIFTLGSRFNFNREVGKEEEFERLDSEALMENEKEPDEEMNLEVEEMEEVIVYIKGAVITPGIVIMNQGARIVDVVEEAGGIADGADLNQVNMARKVQDEEMIHIPYQGEEVSSTEESSAEAPGSSENTGAKVNINTASKEELKSLPGIGDATADKIISHRESSKFKGIEDIMDVSGIGEKKFEGIKESIVAN